jgi:hypothetical protein
MFLVYQLQNATKFSQKRKPQHFRPSPGDLHERLTIRTERRNLAIEIFCLHGSDLWFLTFLVSRPSSDLLKYPSPFPSPEDLYTFNGFRKIALFIYFNDLNVAFYIEYTTLDFQINKKVKKCIETYKIKFKK